MMTEETKRNYFAIRPLATRLISSTETIQIYESGKGLTDRVTQAFQGVDIEVWARQFLQAMDDFLSSLPPDYRADWEREDGTDGLLSLPAQEDRAGGLWPDIERVVDAAAELAEAIADGVDYLFQVPADLRELERVRKGVKRALPGGLSAGYATDAVFESSAVLLYTHGTPVPCMCGLPSGTSRKGIPVPLRMHPAAPAVLAQSRVQTSLYASDVRQARQWNFEFTFESLSEDQDTIYITIVTDPKETPGLQSETPSSSLFTNLAQFVQVYPAIKPDLPVPLNPDSPDTQVAGPAVKAFADIAKAVAGGWREYRREISERRSAVADTPAKYSYRLEKRFKDESGSRTLDAITLRVVGDATSPTGHWPSLSVLASDGDYHKLICEPAGDDECVYVYEAPSPWSDGSTIRFGLEDLDIFEMPMMTAAVCVVRNENLGYDPPVNKEFVYRTDTPVFPNPCIAWIQQTAVIPIGPPTTDLANTLSLFFSKLFEKATIPLLVELSVRHCRGLVGDDGLAPEASGLVVSWPVLMRPVAPYQSDLGAEVAEEVQTWWKDNAPGKTGYFEMSVDAFTTSLTTSWKIPLLTLSRVTFSLEE
jgi:hypothetical protein